jgi:hypothetical protein
MLEKALAGYTKVLAQHKQALEYDMPLKEIRFWLNYLLNADSLRPNSKSEIKRPIQKILSHWFFANPGGV